jgi:cytochrome c oxidase subunit 2
MTAARAGDPVRHLSMRIGLLFAAVAVAGMALLPEAPANAGVGKDPATAYASFPAAAGHSSAPQASPPRTIEVVARRFTFEPATIEVAVGERVRLLVRSADGVHGVGIRKFKVNALIPRGGAPVAIDFVASAAGTFPMLCSEACGDGHADMRGSLVVTSH